MARRNSRAHCTPPRPSMRTDGARSAQSVCRRFCRRLVRAVPPNCQRADRRGIDASVGLDRPQPVAVTDCTASPRARHLVRNAYRAMLPRRLRPSQRADIPNSQPIPGQSVQSTRRWRAIRRRRDVQPLTGIASCRCTCFSEATRWDLCITVRRH